MQSRPSLWVPTPVTEQHLKARRFPTRRAAEGVIAAAVLLVATSCSAALTRPGRAVSRSELTAAPSSFPAATHPSPTPLATTTVRSTPPAALQPTLASPAALTPLVRPALPGEGTWQPAPGSGTAGGYGIYTTQLRPAAGYPPAGVAWMNTTAVRLTLYAGTGEPYGSWPQQGYVAAAQQPSLLAAFNSGFKIYSYRTGWYDQGRTAMPLQTGDASLVIFDNGTATVGAWGRDVTASPTVQAVRQNLTLLVDDAKPAPDAALVGAWGATLHGVHQTWRSAIGVTSSGDLLYVAGPLLDPSLLARLLTAAGAMRAMELDINPEWVSFATYSHTGGAISAAANLLPGMYFPPSHYLQPASRDFIAVFSR